MKEKDWSNYGVVALLPFLFVAIVYATEAFTRTSFFGCGRSDSNCEPIPENIWKVLRIDADAAQSPASDLTGNDEERKVLALRYGGRMTWFFLVEIFLYVSIASLGIASVLIFQLVPQRRIVWAFGALTLSAVVGLFFYRHPKIHMTIFLALFAKAITPDLPAISDITNLLNSLGNAALFSLLIASCATLLPSQDPSFDASSPGGLEQLSKSVKSLRIILYTGTLLLVTAILLKKSIYQWSLAYTPQDDAIETARNFVASLLALDGGFYTLVLAAAYLPAALVLHRRAQYLVGPSLDETAQEGKLKEYGLNFSLKESLPHVLAIAGPLLTGPVAEFLTGSFF